MNYKFATALFLPMESTSVCEASGDTGCWRQMEGKKSENTSERNEYELLSVNNGRKVQRGAAGFRHASYFSHVFREHFGVSASEVRRQR